MRSKPEPPTNTDLAKNVRSILASRNLTLYQASQRSEALYGRSSPHFLPHNLYYELRRGTFNPSVYQFVALSRISGYRLPDWLRVFGFDLENIPRLQVLLPSNRTILLDSSLEDPNSWVPWLRNRAGNAPAPTVEPLAHLLEFTHPRRLRSLPGLADRGFLYAKIGCQDALAFPDLLPGSIVRVNPGFADDLIPRTNGTTTSRIFLVEHSKGFFCSRLRVMGGGLVMPISAQLPYAQIELRLPQEARLLGAVDLEIRPLLNAEQPEVPKELAKHWEPRPLAPTAYKAIRAKRREPTTQMNRTSPGAPALRDAPVPLSILSQWNESRCIPEKHIFRRSAQIFLHRVFASRLDHFIPPLLLA